MGILPTNTNYVSPQKPATPTNYAGAFGNLWGGIKSAVGTIGAAFNGMASNGTTPITPAAPQASGGFQYTPPSYGGITVPNIIGPAKPAATAQPQPFIGPVMPQMTAQPTAQKQATPAPVAQNVVQKQQIVPQVSQGGMSVASAGAPVLPNLGTGTASGGQPTQPQVQATDVSPEAILAANNAKATYEQALRISPEELSTQEDIDKLLSEASALGQSARMGMDNTAQQTIAMDFITGQQKAIEDRLTTKLTGIQAQSEPLEKKMARLEAARKSSLEASKFSLERADKEVESQKTSAQKAKEQSESTRRWQAEQDLAQKKYQSDVAMADRKFEEDKRQFGATYAQNNRKIALDEAQFALDKSATTGVDQTKMEAIGLVNELLPKVGNIAGVFRAGALTGDKAKLKQLTDKLALDARKLIKGSGPVSDMETQMLKDSATALSGGYFSGKMSEQFVDKELKRVRGALNMNSGQTVQVKITDSATGEESVVNTNRDGVYQAYKDGLIVEYL